MTCNSLSDKNYIRALYQLVQCYQAFEKLINKYFKEIGLTSPQFDVIVTLGKEKKALSCKELGEKTFITKGTLTGVVDRLIDKKLLNRKEMESDRRFFVISLTLEGQRIFDEIYEPYLIFIKKSFDEMGDLSVEQLEQSCKTAAYFLNKNS